MARKRGLGELPEARPSPMLGAALLLLACVPAGVHAEPSRHSDPPESHVKELVESNNRLAWKLHLGSKPARTQLIASLPILLELQALTSGATGETLRELRAAVGIPEAVDEYDYLSLISRVSSKADYAGLPDGSEGARVRQQVCSSSLDAALWIDDRVTLRQRFINEVHRRTNLEVERVDFHDRAQVQRRVKMWAQRTLKLDVGDVELPELSGRVSGILSLCSHQLQAGWHVPFDAQDTIPAAFYTGSGRPRSVQMMSGRRRVRYVEDELAQVVALQASGGMDTFLVLPRAEVRLDELETRLSDGLFDRYRSDLKSTPGLVSIPRMIFHGIADLREPVRSLGVARVFDAAQSQLGGSVGADPMTLVGIRQASHYAIDEMGISAAALRVGSPGDVEGLVPQFEFTANRPFLIVIRHSATGAVLFVGRYAGPVTDTR